MNVTRAWLLPISVDRQLAVGIHFMATLLWQPPCWHLAGMPVFSTGWVAWPQGLLPLFDLRLLLGETHALAAEHVVVLRYLDSSQRLLFAGLRVMHRPSLITVSDDQVCQLPDDHGLWRQIAPSCFRAAQSVVPIIDPSRLFNLNYAELAALSAG